MITRASGRSTAGKLALAVASPADRQELVNRVGPSVRVKPPEKK